jgi:mono/diheme cytochrome c family protein
LAFSTLSQTEKINIITNDRERMPAYKDQLTGEQIENVADFIALLEK